MITDVGLTNIAQQCRGLQLLSIGQYSAITNTSIIEVAKQCTGLTSLNIVEGRAITDDGIIEIARRCLGLRSINFCACSAITDNGMIQIARNKQLQSLSIYYCEKITDITLIEISTNCFDLQTLDINTDRHLDMEDRFTSTGIVEVARHCPGIKVLRISERCDISDDDLIEIARHCPDLTTLEINGCEAITVYGINELRRLLPIFRNDYNLYDNEEA